MSGPTTQAGKAMLDDRYAGRMLSRRETAERIAAIEAEARAPLVELVDATASVMGTLGYYIGPSARTAVSREAEQKYERLRDALKAARAALVATAQEER